MMSKVTREVIVCAGGCGQQLGKPGTPLNQDGYCLRCAEEMEALRYWDFEKHQRREPKQSSASKACDIALMVAVIAFALYLSYKYAVALADWICAGGL
jgi:hypothetical protein